MNNFSISNVFDNFSVVLQVFVEFSLARTLGRLKVFVLENKVKHFLSKPDLNASFSINAQIANSSLRKIQIANKLFLNTLNYLRLIKPPIKYIHIVLLIESNASCDKSSSVACEKFRDTFLYRLESGLSRCVLSTLAQSEDRNEKQITQREEPNSRCLILSRSSCVLVSKLPASARLLI